MGMLMPYEVAILVLVQPRPAVEALALSCVSWPAYLLPPIQPIPCYPTATGSTVWRYVFVEILYRFVIRKHEYIIRFQKVMGKLADDWLSSVLGIQKWNTAGSENSWALVH